MKVLYMAVAITALSMGQPAGGPIAGSWTAKFEDRTFIRLEIKTVAGTIAGGISVGTSRSIPTAWSGARTPLHRSSGRFSA